MKYLFLLSFLFLFSCTSLTKKDCENINWKKEGYINATKGIPAGQAIKKFKNSCVDEHQVAIDVNSFTSGYQSGLEKYCTKENLYSNGLSGENYYGVCKESDAVASYTNGKIKFLEDKISDLESENDDLKRKNSDLESKVMSCSN